MQSVANMDASNALRAQTRAICLRIKAQHEAYQLEMHAAFDIFFNEKSQALKQGFDLISAGIADGRSIHDGLSCIATAMNKQLAFDSRDSFSRHPTPGGHSLSEWRTFRYASGYFPISLLYVRSKSDEAWVSGRAP